MASKRGPTECNGLSSPAVDPKKSKKGTVDFSKVDWSDKSNQFDTTKPNETVFDDEEIDGWSKSKPEKPFLDIETTEYDDLDLFSDDADVPSIFKYFVSPKLNFANGSKK